MDYGEELAQLVYSFVVGPAPTGMQVRGTLRLDVSFPCNTEISQFPPGQLFYSTSGDGLAWSAPQSLQAGHYDIPLQSAKSTCYVLLGGTHAVIDNLRFSPAAPGATVRIVSRTVTQSLRKPVPSSTWMGNPGGTGTTATIEPMRLRPIQQAINMAQDGDTVVVWPGVYQEEIRFKGKAITVQSAADAAVITAPVRVRLLLLRCRGPRDHCDELRDHRLRHRRHLLRLWLIPHPPESDDYREPGRHCRVWRRQSLRGQLHHLGQHQRSTVRVESEFQLAGLL